MMFKVPVSKSSLLIFLNICCTSSKLLQSSHSSPLCANYVRSQSLHCGQDSTNHVLDTVWRGVPSYRRYIAALPVPLNTPQYLLNECCNDTWILNIRGLRFLPTSSGQSDQHCDILPYRKDMKWLQRYGRIHFKRLLLTWWWIDRAKHFLCLLPLLDTQGGCCTWRRNLLDENNSYHLRALPSSLVQNGTNAIGEPPSSCRHRVIPLPIGTAMIATLPIASNWSDVLIGSWMFQSINNSQWTDSYSNTIAYNCSWQWVESQEPCNPSVLFPGKEFMWTEFQSLFRDRVKIWHSSTCFGCPPVHNPPALAPLPSPSRKSCLASGRLILDLDASYSNLMQFGWGTK